MNVAKTGLWAEIQGERARQQRLRDQELRAFRQAEERDQRGRAKARKAAVRKAAADLKESKRLYLEGRKAEAEGMSRALQDRVVELDGVLIAGIRHLKYLCRNTSTSSSACRTNARTTLTT